MKIIITEEKLFNTIYDYIEKSFSDLEIGWVFGKEENNDDYFIEDNENFLIFFNGKWQGEDYSDIIFNYFDEDYYIDTPGTLLEDSPILEVMGKYAEELDDMFSNHWYEPMKEWFRDNFDLPVKTITTYYNYN